MERGIGALLGLLFIVAGALLIMPFYGAYKLVTGEESTDRALGGVLLVVGTLIYFLAAIG